MEKISRNPGISGRSIKKFLDSPAALNFMYLPALALFVVFIIYPLVQGFRISFTNWDGYSAHYSFVGLEKYVYMFTDIKIRRVIVNTLIYGLGSTLFQNVLGLAYAVFLNGKIKARGLIRTVIYFPVIASPLIMGYIWYFVFQYDRGALNDIVFLLGKEATDWLGDGQRAVWIMTFVNTYQFVGVAMVVYLAGLQAIPRDLLEAAEVDGAHGWTKFTNVTLPLLAPAITISMVLNIIYGLKLFDVIMAMTNGGPGDASHSLSTIMYDLYFSRQDAGYAAALGNLMFLMISALGLGALWLLRKREVDL
jgi:raffinose/stachyose/melibiose transport system permease protein